MAAPFVDLEVSPKDGLVCVIGRLFYYIGGLGFIILLPPYSHLRRRNGQNENMERRMTTMLFSSSYIVLLALESNKLLNQGLSS
jgi:hypothetical protein